MWAGMEVGVSKFGDLEAEVARSRSIKALQAEIARSRYKEAPTAGWVELVEEYRADDKDTPAASTSYWVDAHGQTHHMAPAETRIVEALRTTMRTDRGKWLALKLVVKPNGRYRYAFDYSAAPARGRRRPSGAMELAPHL